MYSLQTDQASDANNLDTVELIDQLHHATTPTEMVTLIQALTVRKTAAVIESLIQILHHRYPAVLVAAVDGLVALAPETVEPLMATFQTCRDHGVQAYIVQALARIGDGRALDLLIEVVGIEVANHCQGNVRRVAARGLGQIGKTSGDHLSIHLATEKLAWVLFHTEDWALRYAAVVSLQEIATTEAIAVLQQALTQESDPVVQLRIKTAMDSSTMPKPKQF